MYEEGSPSRVEANTLFWSTDLIYVCFFSFIFSLIVYCKFLN